METKPIPRHPNLFYAIDREHKPVLPKFVFPSVWFEHRRQGLEVNIVRVTFAWWTYRLHVHVGKTTPAPLGVWDAPELGVRDFVTWASAWSKNAWPDVSWSQDSVEKWLQQSEWKMLVRWGGAKYHYSRIILAKEFLLSQPTPVVASPDLNLLLDTNALDASKLDTPNSSVTT